MGAPSFKPVPFEIAPRDGEGPATRFQILLDFETLARIEKACEAPFPMVMNQMEKGFLSVIIAVAAIVIKRISEVGPVPIEMHEVGPIVAPGVDGAPSPYMAALVEATTALGNGLGLSAPLPPPIESGAGLDSVRKPSSRSKTGPS